MTAETNARAGACAPTGRRSSGSRPCCCRSPRDGAVDWSGLESLLRQTVDAGLVPAVNMDTGYVQLLDADTRHACARTRATRRAVRPGSWPVRSSPTSRARRSTSTRTWTRWTRSPRVGARRWCSRRTGSTRWTTRSGSRRTRRSGSGSTASSASSSARCSCPTAGSTRWPRTKDCSASRAASAPSTRRCRARSSGTGSRSATGCGPTSTCSPATTSPSTWCVTDPTTCSGSRRSRPKRSPNATGGGPHGDRAVPRAQRPAAVPRRLRVPGTGARVPPRRGAVPVSSAAGSRPTRHRRARRGAPTATAPSSRDIAERLEAML